MNAMFYEDDDDRHNPEVYDIFRHELLALESSIANGYVKFHRDPNRYSLRTVPTHTEDGIPIRKLYVANLPPKTTRTELFGVFAQFGFIKSCWLRMSNKGPMQSPTPTYAFVTYSNPADAHKALQAPSHEKTLRGRNLHTSPADSWHQPVQDADGRVRWKPRALSPSDARTDAVDGNTATIESTSEGFQVAAEGSSAPEPELPEESGEITSKEETTYTMLDILNRDCVTHILSYVPITDLIRSERVSKSWRSMVQEYLQGMRTFKTSWWTASPSSLTTAVLRLVLQRANSLARLHIDHHWSALNDRTAHTVGKFCPNLDELKVVGMHTRNWNPLIYGCKQLKSLSFVSCNKLTDSSLIQLVKSDSCVEKLTVANNTHVTGIFLTSGSNPPKLNSLSFYNCYSLQGTVLCAAIETLPNLSTLRLDVCPYTMWKIIPMILKKLPQLEELSLSEYMSVDPMKPLTDELCESFATLTELKVLNLFKNIFVTNAVLKQIAQSCPKLEDLNVSSCNSRKVELGVGDEGVSAICSSCRQLTRLDVSYLRGLSDAGLRAAALPRLRSLTARGNPALSAAPFAAALRACPDLQEVDVCGCDSVSEEVASAALQALQLQPRRLTVRLAGTAADHAEDLPTHKLLTVNVTEDLSNPHLRLDFVDNVFDDHPDDFYDDVYDQEEDIEEIFFPNPDDEYMMDPDPDIFDYDGIYAYGLNRPNILLL